MNTDEHQSNLLSLVLPVYNEESGIAALLLRLQALRQSGAVPIEVIFVDDHSQDNTPAILREACRTNANYRYLRLARNSGSHTAILAGLSQARGECAVFLAADLQDPPELVPEMLRLWHQGNHVVWAVREKREGIPLMEQLLSRMFYWLMNRFSDVRYPPQGADFAMLDRRVVSALLASVGSDVSLGADISALGFRCAEVPYVKAIRQFGRSKWNLRMKLKAFADAFVGHSYAPIRFMSYSGILMGAMGFLYAWVVVALRLTLHTPVEGWASLMVITLLLGGMQMTMLGVLGEYLIRALREARRRPHYIVEDYMDYESTQFLSRKV